MKRLLALLALAASPAFAADWNLISTSEEYLTYMDSTSFKSKGTSAIAEFKAVQLSSGAVSYFDAGLNGEHCQYGGGTLWVLPFGSKAKPVSMAFSFGQHRSSEHIAEFICAFYDVSQGRKPIPVP